MAQTSGDATVLVVDDEEAVADAYMAQLKAEYDTRTAYGGEEALATVEDDVDVVLLDRRMPDKSGDEVLERIRERGVDCRVVMVTAVDPDFDIVDMPFEDYLQKPTSRDELFDVIEQQLVASEYDQRVTEYIEVTTKLGLLEREKSTVELEDDEDVRRLRERADRLRAELDDAVAKFDEPEDAFRDLL